MIARLDLAAIHDLREALPQFAHLPLAHLHDLSSERRRAYWLDEISQSLAKESSIAFRGSSPEPSTDSSSIMIPLGTAK